MAAKRKRKGRGDPEKVWGQSRTERGYAKAPGSNVARILEEQRVERERAEAHLRSARAIRLERRNKTEKKGNR